MDPNWTELPLTHPIPFSIILLHCSPLEILSCRAACSTWKSWFSSCSSIWSKKLVKMLEGHCETRFLNIYRVRKLLEQGDQESEADCLKMCMKLNRINQESEILVSKDTMARVKKLEKEIPVMGPPAIFVRLKVNHPTIKKIIGEMLSRYLTCIILDKQDAVKDFVKMLVLRSMYGQDGAQNWVYVDNLRPKTKDEEDSVNELEGVVLDGPDKLEEALKLSLQSSRGEKKKKSGRGRGRSIEKS